MRAAKQRGAALLTAMIIVTLIASLAGGMVWQQYRAVQIEAAERARTQSGWILLGALDWARLILLEDFKGDRDRPPASDDLGEPWSVPLAESRLSTFLSADKGQASTDEGPEAFLSGSILDLQSRYNLRHLLAGAQVDPLELRVLDRLCTTVNAPPGSAQLIAKQLRESFGTVVSQNPGNQPQNPPQTPPTPNGAPPPATPTPANGNLQPVTLDQLSWLDIPRSTIDKLRPYVVFLPKPTPVNLNTAPREVIYALFDGLNLADAERLVESRKGRPLKDISQAQGPLGPKTAITPQRASVTTSFFEVTGRLRLEERRLEQRSVIERRGQDMVVLGRERISQILENPQRSE